MYVYFFIKTFTSFFIWNEFILTSIMIAVKFHACWIWNHFSLRDFLIPHKILDKIWWKWMKLNMFLSKIDFLIWNPSIKIIFRMIKLIFSQKIDFENWKCPFFDCTQSSCLLRYQKILWESSFGCKNVLNFIHHTMKFHNLHHTNGPEGNWRKTCLRFLSMGFHKHGSD